MILERATLPLVAGGDRGLEGLLVNFRNAAEQVDWALFFDDTFIDPYLLKSWLYQYVDLRRTEDEGSNDNKISTYFPNFIQGIDFLQLS
jgi:hypothetical protein